MKENIYWNRFYKNSKAPIKSSSFAKFAKTKLKKINLAVYDIGCGNARDTIFFLKNKIDCYGLDVSEEVINKNKISNIKYKEKFLRKNFCNFFKKKLNKKFVVYSRFTWHSINYSDEKKLISTLKKNKNFKYLFIEARSIKDKIYGKGKKIGKHEFITSHYRRFIDPLILKEKLSKFTKIIYFKESTNLAKYKKENPCVMRIIAKAK